MFEGLNWILVLKTQILTVVLATDPMRCKHLYAYMLRSGMREISQISSKKKVIPSTMENSIVLHREVVLMYYKPST